MSSYKWIYRAKLFGANLFASGIFRGHKADVTYPTGPGIELRHPGDRKHYKYRLPRGLRRQDRNSK